MAVKPIFIAQEEITGVGIDVGSGVGTCVGRRECVGTYRYHSIREISRNFKRVL
jgi:hypothetical protein